MHIPNNEKENPFFATFQLLSTNFKFYENFDLLDGSFLTAADVLPFIDIEASSKWVPQKRGVCVYEKGKL